MTPNLSPSSSVPRLVCLSLSLSHCLCLSLSLSLSLSMSLSLSLWKIDVSPVDLIDAYRSTVRQLRSLHAIRRREVVATITNTHTYECVCVSICVCVCLCLFIKFVSHALAALAPCCRCCCCCLFVQRIVCCLSIFRIWPDNGQQQQHSRGCLTL